MFFGLRAQFRRAKIILGLIVAASFTLAGFITLLLSISGSAQSAPASAKAASAKKEGPQAPPPVFEISLTEDTDYQPLPWQGHAVENYCIGDGNIYVLKPSFGLIALTPNGIVSFLTDKMTDIPNPSTTFLGLNPSLSSTSVAFPVLGIDDSKVETTTSTDDHGHIEVHKDATNAMLNYLVRFDKDGTYKGAIKPDLPFLVYKFATFDSGILLAQGKDQNNVPRIALLDASAQFLRYLDLRKDISTSLSGATDDVKCEGCTADLNSVVFSSLFTPWHGKFLLKREFTGSGRVYEIDASGQARVVTVKVPKDYDVGFLIPTDRNWFFRLNKLDSKGSKPEAVDSFLEVDPENGKPLREYRVKPPDTAPEISCVFDNEFWGVRRDTKEEKINVVRGTAQLYQGK